MAIAMFMARAQTGLADAACILTSKCYTPGAGASISIVEPWFSHTPLKGGPYIDLQFTGRPIGVEMADQTPTSQPPAVCTPAIATHRTDNEHSLKRSCRCFQD